MTMTPETAAVEVLATAAIDGPHAALRFVETAERDAIALRNVADAMVANAKDAADRADMAERFAQAARAAYTNGGAS